MLSPVLAVAEEPNPDEAKFHLNPVDAAAAVPPAAVPAAIALGRAARTFLSRWSAQLITRQANVYDAPSLGNLLRRIFGQFFDL